MKTHKKGLMLSIDCGTQSLRAMLFDRRGRMIGKVKENYTPYFSTEEGMAEQHPEVYYRAMIKCVRSLREAEPEKMEQVEGIAVATMRDTIVLLDDKGEVVRPSLLWLDQRQASCEGKLPLKYDIGSRLVGMDKIILAERKQSKLNWVKENEPENWAKTCHLLLISGYLNYRLTGLFVDSYASQVGHIPFDYKTRAWAKEGSFLHAMFQVDQKKLSQLVTPGTVMGKVTNEAKEELGFKRNIKVIAAGSDKGCETIGVGCVNPKSISLSFGTAATIQTSMTKYKELISFMPSYSGVDPGKFNPEIQVYRGYWMISWFKKEFAEKDVLRAEAMGILPEELLNDHLDDVPPGAEGLLLQPFWKPEIRKPDAKGAIVGFSDIHTRYHVYRAIIEGINYALMEGLEKIENTTKVKVKKIYVSGGGSNSDSICQLTADMFNLPVIKGETNEASGLGAAIAGFVGLGIYESFDVAVKRMVRETLVYSPNRKNASLYRALYQNAYKEIYPSLGRVYKSINKAFEGFASRS